MRGCGREVMPVVQQYRGLSASEASARLLIEGANELPQQRRRTLLQIAFTTMREPMFALLLGAAIIYLLLGSLEEGLILLCFAGLSVGTAIVQEGRSERVLEALRELTSPRALVIRDGKQLRIPSRELVRGDIVLLSEGDRVPADARLHTANDLQADESLLTGEPVPVRKRAARDADSPPGQAGGDDLPYVYSSTLIVRGSGLAEVLLTGSRSRVGQIGHVLAGIETATPRLTLETRRVVRTVAMLGLLCCMITVVLFGLFRGSWLEALLAGLALGMSMVPEEFPLVLAVFTAMGAWRLSQARVLTRRASAIETLGAATVLCTDKTGTLTENRMTIAEVRTEDGVFRFNGSEGVIPDAMATVVARGVLASAVDPFDPMEKAFHALAARTGKSGSEARSMGAPARAYPLRPELLAVTHAWADEGGYAIAAKGAPEAIIALCRLDAVRIEKIRRDIDAMASAGMRVLAVAEARHAAAILPDSPAGFEFSYLGLVGFADPIRDAVPGAVRECQSAGIRVIMITGDYPLTAQTIALQAGLPAGEVVTGSVLDELDDAAFASIAGRVNIFARIAPEQKLRLVQALKANGEVVAMTGDGVNDAPALRAADIGVAMGGRGTDVAREASSIVLLDDDFASIVRTIKVGRRIYDNLRKAMGYIIAVHIPIGGIVLLPLLTGLPLILAPVHIAFLEMVIDPICSIVFEAEKEESNVMRRPPRAPTARILSSSLIQWGVIQGAAALLVVAAVYFGGHFWGMPERDLRALTFIVLLCGNLALVLVNRSFSAGGLNLLKGTPRIFYVIAAAVVGLLTVALLWPPARKIFQFGVFHGHDLLLVIASLALLVLTLEVVKAARAGRYQEMLAR